MDQNLQSQIDLAVRSLDNELAREILVTESRAGTSNLSRLDFLRLNFLRMNTLSVERLLVILTESLIIPFSIPDFNFENKIVDYVELLDYIPEQVDFMVKFKQIIENHAELLGAKNISVEGKPVAPAISNWIKDYDESIAEDDQNALGEMRYVNTNTNARQLTAEERTVLQKILRLYDKLTQYVLLWENLPETLPQEELDKFDEYANNLYLKSVEDEVDEPQKDFDLAPKPVAQKQSPVSIVPPVIEQPSTAIPVPPPYTIPLQKDLDLSTQPKKGLVFDIPTNVDLDQEVEERKKRSQQQEQLAKIQAKLEDLKKRKKNN